VLSPIQLNLSGSTLVLIKPTVQVSTAEAYAGISPRIPAHALSDILQKPLGQWKELLKNDFEESVFATHPSILEVKNKLYQQGAVYASMSGSGSAVYGLFEKDIFVEDSFSNAVIWKSVLGQ
jgi:4-diphosphocytidyl-2-C-methyl-D-erythritol kinase